MNVSLVLSVMSDIFIGIVVVILICLWFVRFRIHKPTIEFIRGVEGEDNFRDDENSKIDLYAYTWIALFSNTYAKDTREKLTFRNILGKEYRFEINKYTYIAVFGYTLKEIGFRENNTSGPNRGHLGFVKLGIDCEKNAINVYRISHCDIEPPPRIRYLMWRYEKIAP